MEERRERKLTPHTKSIRNQTGDTNETHRVKEDFEAITRLTDGGPGTMGAKSDIVGCRP